MEWVEKHWTTVPNPFTEHHQTSIQPVPSVCSCLQCIMADLQRLEFNFMMDSFFRRQGCHLEAEQHHQGVQNKHCHPGQVKKISLVLSLLTDEHFSSACASVRVKPCEQEQSNQTSRINPRRHPDDDSFTH